MVLYLRLFLVDDLKVCSAFITLSVLWIGKRPTNILGATLEALSLGDRHGCPPFFWMGGGMPLARLRQGQHTGGGLHVAQGAANRCNPCFPWQSPPRQHLVYMNKVIPPTPLDQHTKDARLQQLPFRYH